jgi:putative drug exporter of the RND superfamily
VLERWSRAAVRARFAVIACWLVVLAVGAFASTRLTPLLSASFAVPGSDSERARTILARRFDERVDGGFVVVFRVRRPSDRVVRGRLRRRLALAARSVPTGHAGSLQEGGGVVYGNVATRLDLRQASRHTVELRRALRGTPRAYVTGQPAIQHDLDRVFASDLRRGEAIAIPVALAIVVATLGPSLAVAIPFLFAACTITATLGLVYLLAREVSMVTYVTNVVVFIAVALAVDYSLLIVSRFREELAAGRPTEDAVAATMSTAGRAVVVSGTAVAIGLGLLILVPVPFVRSMGVAGLLIPLVSIAGTLTLQPALLAVLGRHRLHGVAASGVERGPWARFARAVMRRPTLPLIGGAVVLVAAAAPALSMKLTPGSISGIPRTPESMRGYSLLRRGVGPGVVTPTQIVVDAGVRGRARAHATRAALDRLVDEIFDDRETFVVATGPRAPYVEDDGRYARVITAGRHDFGDEPSQDFVHRLRDRYVPSARLPSGVHAFVGGPPAQGVDFLARLHGAFPWLVAGVLALTYVVLLRAFRSLVLPLQAIVLNVLSVSAAYGLLTVAFGRVDGWIPIFLFAMLFGLSMDYEVFLVSRMREFWESGEDNTSSVAHGLERTGRIVTAAAAIMVASFSGLLVGRIAALQQLGVGLAVAVVLDATIVRAVLVPSSMALLGRLNWWLPVPVARVARVAPSPLAGSR